MTSHTISHEDFEPYAGSKFCLLDSGTTTTVLDLLEITPLKSLAGPALARIPFSLIFRSADQHVLPQRLYRMAHDDMGEMDIFIVPLGRDAEGVLYEAAFN